MSNVEALSQAVLRELLTDFAELGRTFDNLRSSYVGPKLDALKLKLCGNSASSVDFDLAVNDLETNDLVGTGPMAVYDNPPNSSVMVIGLFSNREYVYLTEKGYKSAQKTQSKPGRAPSTQNVHISGGHFHQSPIGIGGHVTQSLTGTFGDAPVFANLRKAIDESSLDDIERGRLLNGVSAMEKAPDRTGFVDRYRDFISLAADHMTIIGPLLPALSALLSGH
jgi:hypothetical protein